MPVAVDVVVLVAEAPGLGHAQGTAVKTNMESTVHRNRYPVVLDDMDQMGVQTPTH